jgi:hypothetical protein
VSLKEKILASDDLPFQDVPTSEWEKAGVPTVRIRTMSAADRDTWEAAALIARARAEGTDRLRNLRAELVARCAVDPETGERIFADEDVEALGKKSAKVLDRLFSVATDLNAVTDSDMKALEKNFAGGRSGDSYSALRWLVAASTWIGSLPNLVRGKSQSGSPSSGSKAIH